MRDLIDEYGFCIVVMILGMGIIAGLSGLLGTIVSGEIWRLWYA